MKIFENGQKSFRKTPLTKYLITFHDIFLISKNSKDELQ